MSPPLKPTTPPKRCAWRAANSSTRHAPWEKPRRITRSCFTCSVILASTSSSTEIADERYGSLLSIGAVNGFGYHVLPAASGARYAKSGWVSSWPTLMMSAALAPRPCTRSIAAWAIARGVPACSTGCPAWGPVIAYSFVDADFQVREPAVDPLGRGLRTSARRRARAPGCQARRAGHDEVAAGRQVAARAAGDGDDRSALARRPNRRSNQWRARGRRRRRRQLWRREPDRRGEDRCPAPGRIPSRCCAYDPFGGGAGRRRGLHRRQRHQGRLARSGPAAHGRHL